MAEAPDTPNTNTVEVSDALIDELLITSDEKVQRGAHSGEILHMTYKCIREV